MVTFYIKNQEIAVRTTYKSFIRPYLDYGDILYKNTNNGNFQKKIEKVQYKAFLAIADVIQGTSRENFDEEFGLHSFILNKNQIVKEGLFPLICIRELNNLKDDIRNTKSIVSKKHQKKYRTIKKSIVTKNIKILFFFVYDPPNKKLLTRLRLNFSYLKEQKVRHAFADWINMMNTFFCVGIFTLPKYFR